MVLVDVLKMLKNKVRDEISSETNSPTTKKTVADRSAVPKLIGCTGFVLQLPKEPEILTISIDLKKFVRSHDIAATPEKFWDEVSRSMKQTFSFADLSYSSGNLTVSWDRNTAFLRQIIDELS